MIDFDRIPEPLYYELVDLFGEEQTERYIHKVNYNLSRINRDLFMFKVYAFYKKNKWTLLMMLLSIFGAIIFTFYLR